MYNGFDLPTALYVTVTVPLHVSSSTALCFPFSLSCNIFLLSDHFIDLNKKGTGFSETP